MIGVNAVMHALGVLAMALVLVPRIGARRMALGALVLAGVVLALFPADRRRLAIILGLVATGCALFWPVVLNHPWIAYPVLFLWGGVFVGIFTLMMTLVGSSFDGADLVGIYAVMDSSGASARCSVRLSPVSRWTFFGTAYRFLSRSRHSLSSFTQPRAAARHDPEKDLL